MGILLGCIADDFTGATDLASMLVKQGMNTILVVGVPEADNASCDANAAVVALKSRSAPVAEAVAQSLAALAWLRTQGARQIFFKYCSTFDSTNEGNIGPVADALMDALRSDFSFVCPAFPTNGRTIYQGHLFVGNELLSDSAMRHHPLTPMRDSSLVRLMRAQTRREVGLVARHHVSLGTQSIDKAANELRQGGCSYAVVDAIEDDDLVSIGRAAASHVLVTGGSGIAMSLPENFRRQGLLGDGAEPFVPRVIGREAVLVGSCSNATRAQVENAARLWPSRKLDVDAMARGEPVIETAVAWAVAQDVDTPVLIHSCADPDEVRAVQARLGRERAGAMVEDALARLARHLVDVGVRRLIVAGGETSGAVVSALGIRGLAIGIEIDPGVPWTQSLDEPIMALALKSGNFGGADFFAKAFGMLP